MQIRYVVLAVSLMISGFANANCGVRDAKITEIHQYYDGSVFVNFDKAGDCDCSIKNRMAFKVGDANIEFIQSMVLLAYASGKSVTAFTDSASCSVHGNTAKLNYFRILPD